MTHYDNMEPKRRKIPINKTATVVIENSLTTNTLSASETASNSQTSCSTSSQYLVMMPNNRDIQNVFLKRNESFSKSVEQKRRLMHKEIERRRRDKINDWILVLSKQVPDCASDRTKQGQSKGGILAKTAKYIQDLRTENERLSNALKEKDELSDELERLRKRLMEVENENQKLISLIKNE